MDLISEANKKRLEELELAHHGNTEALADNLANINSLLRIYSDSFGGKPENKKAYISYIQDELIQLVINVR